MAEEELKTGVQFEGKEEYIKDVFTEIADYYDEMNEIMSMHMVQGWHRFMMRKAGDIRGKRCLDVGTGTGEIAFHVARTAGEGSTVVGVDITPRMLELAARKEAELGLPVRIDWREGDALNLDFPDGSFSPTAPSTSSHPATCSGTSATYSRRSTRCTVFWHPAAGSSSRSSPSPRTASSASSTTST